MDDAPAVIPTLSQATTAIYAAVDNMVLQVGHVLDVVYATRRGEYDDWVVNDLPFGLDTARRFRAIYRAYRSLPPEILARMPAPWQALFALRNIPEHELARLQDAGEIGPGTSVEESRRIARRYYTGPEKAPVKFAERTGSKAEFFASKLMEYRSDDLRDATRAALQAWIRASVRS